jgi:predicted dehydrogenase
MGKLRIGVAGLGIGKRHLVSYGGMEDVEIVAVADPRMDAAEAEAAKWGAAAYADGATMIREAGLDAVSVCTPPALHLPLSCAAANAGVAVLCEKPMAPSVTDCSGMVEACRSAGVTLMVAQKKRFHPLIRRMKEAAGGELGPIRWAVCKYALGRVPMDWFWDEADGGGPLLENSIHTVDMLRHLVGEVATVYAAGGNLFNDDRAPQIDSAAVTLTFEGGAVAALGLGQASEWSHAEERFYFACERGEAAIEGQFDCPTHWWQALRDGSKPNVDETVPPDDCFDAEIGHFLQCVRTGAEPLVSGEAARGSVAVCLAIKESIRTGQPVRPQSTAL